MSTDMDQFVIQKSTFRTRLRLVSSKSMFVCEVANLSRIDRQQIADICRRGRSSINVSRIHDNACRTHADRKPA